VYHDGTRVLYVSIANDKGNEKEVTQSEYKPRDEQWQIVDDSYDLYLRTSNDLDVFEGKMFGMWEGNHRVIT
jgi:hypothetical protein